MDELLASYNIQLIQDKLSGARGFTVKKNDIYVVVIGEHLSEKRKLKTILHEVVHIRLGHLDERKDLDDIQKEWEVNFLMSLLFPTL